MERLRIVRTWHCALSSQIAGRRARPAVWHAGVVLWLCMLGDGARGSATFDPQRGWAPFCDVICIRSIIQTVVRSLEYDYHCTLYLYLVKKNLLLFLIVNNFLLLYLSNCGNIAECKILWVYIWCHSCCVSLFLFIYLFLIFIQGSPFTDRWSSMGP